MTTTLTIPKSNVPIGSVTIDGVTYDVPQHREFVRFFYDLGRRTGGTTAQTNVTLQESISDLDSDALITLSDPLAHEAMRAVDELRNELSTVRNDYASLRSRIAQLEDRLT